MFVNVSEGENRILLNIIWFCSNYFERIFPKPFDNLCIKTLIFKDSKSIKKTIPLSSTTQYVGTENADR